MTALWGMTIVLGLVCIVLGQCFINLAARVRRIEASLAKQRELRGNAIREVLAHLKDK